MKMNFVKILRDLLSVCVRMGSMELTAPMWMNAMKLKVNKF